MDQIVKLVDTQAEDQSSSKERIWRERPLSDKWLFRGQDEAGRRGWFVRLDVTGLYPRRIGPFATRGEALDYSEQTGNGATVHRGRFPDAQGTARVIKTSRSSPRNNPQFTSIGACPKPGDV